MTARLFTDAARMALAAAIGGSVLATPALSASLSKPLSAPRIEGVEVKAGDKSGKTGDKDWAKATKDTEIVDGLFRIYKGEKTWYLQLGPDQLDEPYLLALTVGRGIGSKFLLSGLTLTENVVSFRREGDKIFLYKDNVRFTAPGDSALMRAVERSFGPSAMHAFKIEGEKGDTVLVDLGDFLISDYADVTDGWRQALGGKARLMEKLSSLGELKAFPKNLEMEAKLTLQPGNREQADVQTTADDRSIPVTIRYSLVELPGSGFVPRLLDDRLGYFPTAAKDFTRDDHENYMIVFANRWRLEKKDPSARLSEPVKPITFYLENTIPEKWRPYIRQGIEEWQKAFEEAGFKNAIVAKDQPEDDPTWDAADVRYATIRWITSSSPSFGAIGPSRVDPRTGEIFDGDILIEASMILGYKNRYRRWLGPETIQESLDGFSKEHMESPLSPFMCSYGSVLYDGGNLLNLALLNDGSLPPGSPVPDEYIGQMLVNLTMHEVGHSIGLRHNFQSSVAIPADKLSDKAYISKHGMLGSVMDYDSPWIGDAKTRTSDHVYFSPTVGPYDRWVIRYGYTPTVATSPHDEKDFLDRIAAECTKPGHEYGTDEDTYTLHSMDPRNNIYDMGDDPLQFGIDRTAYLDGVWSDPHFEKRVLAPGVGYQTLRYATNTIFVQYIRSLGLGLKYVGGQIVSRAHYGDPNAPAPFRPVAAVEQRRALQFLTEKAFGPEAFPIAPAILDKLMANRQWTWETPLFGAGRIDYPYYANVLSVQSGILNRLLEPARLERVRETELRQGNALTLSELFNELSGAIWGEFGVGSVNAPARRNPAATLRATSGPGTRRDLQRVYVDNLANWVVNPAPTGTDDARALARLHLTRIDQACARSLASGSPKNDALRAHLMETRARIERALEAQRETES